MSGVTLVCTGLCPLKPFPPGGIPEGPAEDLPGLHLGLVFHGSSAGQPNPAGLPFLGFHRRGRRKAQGHVAGGWTSVGLGVDRLSEQLKIFSEEVKTDKVLSQGHLVALRQPCPGGPLNPKQPTHWGCFLFCSSRPAAATTLLWWKDSGFQFSAEHSGPPKHLSSTQLCLE